MRRDDLDWLLGKNVAVHVGPVDARKYTESAGNCFDNFRRAFAKEASCGVNSGVAASCLSRPLASFVLVLCKRLDFADGRDTALHGDAVNKSARQRR